MNIYEKLGQIVIDSALEKIASASTARYNKLSDAYTGGSKSKTIPSVKESKRNLNAEWKAKNSAPAQNKAVAPQKVAPAVKWTPEMTKAYRAREASAKGSPEWLASQAVINKAYGFKSSRVKSIQDNTTRMAANSNPGTTISKGDLGKPNFAATLKPVVTREMFEKTPAAKSSLWNVAKK